MDLNQLPREIVESIMAYTHKKVKHFKVPQTFTQKDLDMELFYIYKHTLYTYYPNLEELLIHDNPYIKVVPTIKTLKYLSIENCRAISKIEPQPALENLDLYLVDLETIPIFPELTEIRCYYCYNLKIKKQPKIKNIYIYNCPNITRV